MNLDDLRASFADMSDEELMEESRRIRLDRRKSKYERAKQTRKEKQYKKDTTVDLSSLDLDQIKALLESLS